MQPQDAREKTCLQRPLASSSKRFHSWRSGIDYSTLCKNLGCRHLPQNFELRRVLDDELLRGWSFVFTSL